MEKKVWGVLDGFGIGIWDLGFSSGLRFRVWGLGFRSKVKMLGCRAHPVGWVMGMYEDV